MINGKKPDTRFVLAIFLLALVVRVSFICFCGLKDQRYDALYDDLIYVDLARQLLSGHGYTLSHEHFVAVAGQPTSIVPPVYPLFLAGSFFLFGPGYLPVKLLQASISATAVVLIYLIGRRTLGERTGKLAALIGTFYLLFIMYVRPLYTDTLFCFLLAGSVWFAYTLIDRPSLVKSFLWGMLLSISQLTRGEMMVYSVLLVGFVVFSFWRHSGFKVAFHGGALIILGALLVLTPWIARNWKVHGSPTLTENKRWVMWQNNWLRFQREHSEEWREMLLPEKKVLPNWDNLSEIERDKSLWAMNLAFLKTHPTIFVKYSLTRVLHSYPIMPRELLSPPLGYRGVRYRPEDGLPSSSLDDYPLYQRGPEIVRVWSFRFVFLVALLGTALAARRKEFGSVAPLVLIIAANMALSGLIHGMERLRMSIDPYLILLATFFLTYAANWIRGCR